MKKEFKAIIFLNGNRIDSVAKKSGGTWLVGGDLASATTDLGGKIYIISNDKLYFLKGNRMIYQDDYNENYFGKAE